MSLGSDGLSVHLAVDFLMAVHIGQKGILHFILHTSRPFRSTTPIFTTTCLQSPCMLLRACLRPGRHISSFSLSSRVRNCQYGPVC